MSADATDHDDPAAPWAAAPSVGPWEEAVDAAAGERVGEALRRAGFTAEALDDLLGPMWSKPQLLQSLQASVARLGGEPLAVLSALFVAGQRRPAARVAASGVDVSDLVALSFAVVDGDAVVPTIRLEPWRGLVIASDPPVAHRVDRDFVMGPSVSGGRCADLTVRRSVRRALDVGTGAGLQALLLARHADAVVATDVNARALWMAVRNAALNGVTNVEWRLGSWLEPVQGEQFDIVACNAPFVITPRATALYLDGGVSGGGVSEMLARALPEVIAPGGNATLMASWIASSDDPIGPPRAWLNDRECAALALTLRELTPEEHARTWANLPADPDEALIAAVRWADGIRASGEGDVHEGVLLLRRDPRRPMWIEHQAFAPEGSGDAGGHVERMFAGIDLVYGLPPGDEPIDLALVPASTVQLHEIVTVGGGSAEVEQAELRMTDGIAPIGQLDPIMAAALPRMARAATARVAVREAALAAGAPPDALPTLEAQATEVVRELVRFGVLVEPAPGPMPPCPISPDVAAVGLAGRSLAAIGYDDARARAALAVDVAGAIEVPDPLAARLAVDLDTPVGVAAWLFALEQPLDAEHAADVLGDHLARWRDAGLIDVVDDEVVGTVRLVPHGELLVASDRSDLEGDERVPGPHGSADLLLLLTPRTPVARALDLGTGTGIQALAAAAHASEVVATDVVARALDFGRANAALNGITNVSWRLGSWLQPVAGERFDLVVANPPFVISPERRYVYRDGAGGGDEVSREVVRLLPDVMAEGGIAVATVGWVQPTDDPTPAPQHWLGGSGCDGWVLVHELQSPARSAAVWNEPVQDDPGAYQERLDAWARHFDDLGIEAVGYGAVALRRRAGATGVARSTKVSSSTGHAGDRLARMLQHAELLDGATPGSLLDLVVQLSPEVRVVTTWDGRGRTSRLRTDGTLALDMGLDDSSVVLVMAFAEPVTVRSAVVAAADELGLDANDVASGALGLVDVLLRYGLLIGRPLAESGGP
jgi:methylase of polypeptide subunit release factors